MARVTGADVLQIMDDDTAITDDQMKPFITGANLLVTDRLGGEGLASDLLKEIERWTAAHFASMAKEPQAESEGAAGASVTFMSKGGDGLKASRYGQMALALDSTGKLGQVGKRRGMIEMADHIDGGTS